MNGVLKILLIVFLVMFFAAKLLPRLGTLLGVRSRKPFRQAKWLWAWATGSEDDAIRAEGEYGRECAREFAAQFRGRPSAAAQELVAAVGSQVAAALNGSCRTFEFRVISATATNAYALPGGFIFITQPLVDLCGEDRDGLAFILGHEVAHVALGHARSQLTADTILNAVTARLSGAGLLLKQMLVKGYSRELEFAADREGARLAAAAGFDARGAAQALRRLGSPDDGSLAEYFASHPPLAERIARLERG